MTQEYVLLKRELPLLTFQYSQGGTLNIKEVLNEWHLPFCLHSEHLCEKALKEWLLNRCMPLSRDNSDFLMKIANCEDLFDLLLKNYGLSLTDCFWVKEASNAITWHDINFYENVYSDNVGNILLRKQQFEFQISPDITTNGAQNKGWRRRNGRDLLFKTGTAPLYAEPYDEIASSFLKKLFPTLDMVQYYLSEIDGIPCCVCEKFTSMDVEFVAASQLYDFEEDIYSDMHMCVANKAKSLGVKNALHFYEDMLAFDYLIGNNDRRLSNYGFLRSTKTGELIGPAPLFDNVGLFGNGRPALVNQPQYHGCFARVDFSHIKEVFCLMYEKYNFVYGKEVTAQILDSFLQRVEIAKRIQERKLQKAPVDKRKVEGLSK